MNENIPGVDEAVVDNSVQAAAEQEDDVISIEELLDNEAEPAAAEEKGEQPPKEDAPPAEEQGAADPVTVAEQAQAIAKERENNAFAKRLAAEKSKFERDPVYLLGRELAAQHGGDAAKALQAMREQQAQELAKDPAALAKYVIEQRAPAPAPDPGLETDEQRATRIANDLRDVLGDKADLKAYMSIDPDFLRNCDQFGAAYAVAAMAQKATAQNQAAAKIEQNKRLPQPIRPTGNAQPKAVNFTAMSDKEWQAFEAKARKARMDGKRIIP